MARGHLPYDAGARRPGDRLQPGLKWVRLPPASLSSKRLVPSGPRRACPVSGRSAGRVPCRESEPGRDQFVVAQLVEHQADTLGVTGSTPVHNTPRSADEPTAPRRPQGRLDQLCPRGTGGRIGRPSPGSRASPRTRRPDGGDANGRPEARGFRRPSPTAKGRRRGRMSRGFGPTPAPSEAARTRRPGRLKRGSAPRRVTAGRPVPRRHFLIPRSPFIIRHHHARPMRQARRASSEGREVSPCSSSSGTRSAASRWASTSATASSAGCSAPARTGSSTRSARSPSRSSPGARRSSSTRSST